MHALGTVERDNVIAGFQVVNPLAHLEHATRALMARDQWIDTGRVDAFQRGQIGMAKAGSDNLDQCFTMAGRRHLDLFDGQWLVRLETDRGDRADHNASLSG